MEFQATSPPVFSSYNLVSKKNLIRITAVSAVAALLCGGCGGGSPSGPSVTNLNLTISDPLITVGESVQVGWFPNSVGTLTSNFGNDPLPFSGSFTDSPAISTRYQLTLSPLLGSSATAFVDVSVALLPRNVLIVANNSTVSATLETLTRLSVTGNVDDSTTIPSSPGIYDALVVHGSANLTNADAAKVVNWLSAGKKVVILGTAGNKLASGDATNVTTLNISNWLGASILFVDGYTATDSIIYPDSTAIKLSAVLRKSPVLTTPDVTWYSTTDDARLQPGAIKLVREGSDEIGAWVFEPVIGGKVFFQGSAIGASGTSWGDIYRCGLVHILQ